jgi:hypothetical protein
MSTLNANRIEKKQYEIRARHLTDLYRKNIKAPNSFKNPHLDHIVSIDFGYEHNIPVEVITLPENLKWEEKENNLNKGSSLTNEAITLVKNWKEKNLIESTFGSILPEENVNFSFDSMFEEVKREGTAVLPRVPSAVAYNFKPVWCQRREDIRWEKTKRALGKYSLPTHRIMMCAVYPDNRIERLDGNTRTYIFKNGYQHEGYEAPKDWLVIFYAVNDEKDAERLYHSIDSSVTAETFAEKLGGYIRSKGYHNDLPNTFGRGDRVYDIAVVVLDKYKAKNETEELTIPVTKDLAERAAKTAERLDYFIEEFVAIGKMIGRENVPHGLTAPLIGMLIRYLMKYKNGETDIVAWTIINHLKHSKLKPFKRPVLGSYKAENNLYIMLDELQTSESIGNEQNPFIKNIVSASSRRIIPDAVTHTTNNEMDRKLYCGWIAYCIDKYLRGQEMNEDIVYDVTGEIITDETSITTARKIIESARSVLISHYDNFWKS